MLGLERDYIPITRAMKILTVQHLTKMKFCKGSNVCNLCGQKLVTADDASYEAKFYGRPGSTLQP